MMLMLSPFETASTFKQDPQDPIRTRVQETASTFKQNPQDPIRTRVQVDTEIINIRCPCRTH